MTVLARVAAYPDRDFTGKITAVNPSVDPNSRVFILEARFDNPKGELRPGMFANAKVVLPPDKGVVTVPATAVVRDKTTDSNQVFTIDKILRTYVVVAGEADGGQIRIVNGLAGDETVATSGQSDCSTELLYRQQWTGQAPMHTLAQLCVRRPCSRPC
jgi:membrane fusion protein (multidrug efflux system)